MTSQNESCLFHGVKLGDTGSSWAEGSGICHGESLGLIGRSPTTVPQFNHPDATGQENVRSMLKLMLREEIFNLEGETCS